MQKLDCLTCAFFFHGQQSFTDHRGNFYPIEHFFTCSTSFLVYCIHCSCVLLYVGKTIIPLWESFSEHHIKSGSPKYRLSRYSLLHHGKDPNALQVHVIEAISTSLSEGECLKTLCAKETYWILKLNAMSPAGLNEMIEVNTILQLPSRYKQMGIRLHPFTYDLSNLGQKKTENDINIFNCFSCT